MDNVATLTLETRTIVNPDATNTHSSPRTRVSIRRILPWILLAGGLASIPFAFWSTKRTKLPVYGFEVVNDYPHDAGAFSQGLVVDGGKLFEGTGQYGKSSLREVDVESGRVLRQVNLNRQIFGEGITVWNNTVVQLTWKQKAGIIYDRDSFRRLNTFRYSGEGWGITHDGSNLIMSDGSSALRFLDPETFRVVRRISVRDAGRPVRKLNELEYVNGEIFANVWYSDYIARIDPRTGDVKAWIDLRELYPKSKRGREDVLNGIAWDSENQRLFVTGKSWPRLYEIRLTEPE